MATEFQNVYTDISLDLCRSYSESMIRDINSLIEEVSVIETFVKFSKQEPLQWLTVQRVFEILNTSRFQSLFSLLSRWTESEIYQFLPSLATSIQASNETLDEDVNRGYLLREIGYFLKVLNTATLISLREKVEQWSISDEDMRIYLEWSRQRTARLRKQVTWKVDKYSFKLS